MPFATAIAGLGLFLFMVFSRTGGLACDKPFIARFSMLLIGCGLAREQFGGGTRISPRRALGHTNGRNQVQPTICLEMFKTQEVYRLTWIGNTKTVG